MMEIMIFFISFFSSVIGAICGIGGGIIIKPMLDLFSGFGADVVSFLSGCTVLSMSAYSVLRSITAGDTKVSLKTSTPLAIGGAAGGILGKQLFHYLTSMLGRPDTIGAVQNICLAVITLAALLYTVNKPRIRTKEVEGIFSCFVIGLMLGIVSSFLGIGGGPINLVVLYYFFSMETKIAAGNSLYIILFSQMFNLMTSCVTDSVPDFSWTVLIIMAAGGVGGGIAGRALNKRLDSKKVEMLFMGVMIVIILISLYNTWNYLG